MKINACFLLVKNTTKYLIAGKLLTGIYGRISLPACNMSGSGSDTPILFSSSFTSLHAPFAKKIAQNAQQILAAVYITYYLKAAALLLTVLERQ
jgi:hypothetical protein